MDDENPVVENDPDKGNENDTGKGNEKGFPAETKLADMTEGEQLAYWRYQSRKHEAEAKSRSDYDDLKTQLEELRRKGLSDSEKAIEDAKSEARAEIQAEYKEKTAKTLHSATKDMLLNRLGDAVNIDYINLDKFIEGDDINLEAINDFAKPYESNEGNKLGAGKFPKRDPNQGPREPVRHGGFAAGQARAKEQFGIKD